MDRDIQIKSLLKEQSNVKVYLAWKETEQKIAEHKMGEETHLHTFFNSYMAHPSDIATKDKLFDEAVLKLGSLVGSKVIHIVVDYSSKMEKILMEIRAFMNSLNIISAQ